MKINLSSEHTDAQFIHDKLYAYNCLKTGREPQKIPLDPLPGRAVLLLDDEKEEDEEEKKEKEEGKRLGGLVWHLSGERGEIFEIEFLWVSDACRGKGAGSALLREAETIAKQHSCTCLKLFTNTFQAPDFYRKAGFTLTKSEPDPAIPWNTRFYFERELV